MTPEPLDPHKTDLKSLLRSGTWLYKNGQGLPWLPTDDLPDTVTPPVLELGDIESRTIDYIVDSNDTLLLPFTAAEISEVPMPDPLTSPQTVAPRISPHLQRSLPLLLGVMGLAAIVGVLWWQAPRDALTVISPDVPAIPAKTSPESALSLSPFDQAVESADRARELTQTAQTQTDWQIIVTEWETAIEALKAIPPTDAHYAIAQNQVVEYRSQLNTASTQRQALLAQTQTQTLAKDDQVFRSAVQRATQAATLTQTAKTIADWKQVVADWQAAIQYMNEVSVDSPHYAIAQNRIPVYVQNLNYAQSKAK